jgi:hypothetical protein
LARLAQPSSSFHILVCRQYSGNGPLITPVSLTYDSFVAHSRGTSYVYDIPAMFTKAVNRAWTSRDLAVPEPTVTPQELVVDKSGSLIPTSRDPGANTVRLHLRTFLLSSIPLP